MPVNEVDLKEAEEQVMNDPSRYGPQVIEAEVEKARADIVPPAFEQDPLIGRITLTLEEARAALGVGTTTFRTALRNGEIPTVKLGNRRMVPVKALERHLEALAFAEAGAINQWQTALISANANRINRNRRRTVERRKVTSKKLKGTMPK